MADEPAGREPPGKPLGRQPRVRRAAPSVLAASWGAGRLRSRANDRRRQSKRRARGSSHRHDGAPPGRSAEPVFTLPWRCGIRAGRGGASGGSAGGARPRKGPHAAARTSGTADGADRPSATRFLRSRAGRSRPFDARFTRRRGAMSTPTKRGICSNPRGPSHLADVSRRRQRSHRRQAGERLTGACAGAVQWTAAALFRTGRRVRTGRRASVAARAGKAKATAARFIRAVRHIPATIMHAGVAGAACGKAGRRGTVAASGGGGPSRPSPDCPPRLRRTPGRGTRRRAASAPGRSDRAWPQAWAASATHGCSIGSRPTRLCTPGWRLAASAASEGTPAPGDGPDRAGCRVRSAGDHGGERCMIALCGAAMRESRADPSAPSCPASRAAAPRARR